MKTIAKIIVLFLFLGSLCQGITLRAQVISTVTDTTARTDWFDMMQDPNAGFHATQDAFNRYWANRTDYKGNGWKIFKRWEYLNEFRILPDGKLQTPDYVKTEYLRYIKAAGVQRSASGVWNLVGPSAYPSNATYQPNGMGRVNAIAFHPADAGTIYIGSPSGGFWKTTDGGSTWTNLSSNLPNLGVSSILIHPSNPDIIYIGTGDRDAADAPGIGVYKSTDGGVNWNPINSTMDNVTVGAMIMHPSNPNIILAATSGGIYKTTDGGSTWVNKLGPGNFKDIRFNTGDPSIVYCTYASGGNGARLYRSTTTGESWTHITSGIPNAGTAAAGSRIVIGTTPDDASVVYLVQIQQSSGVFQTLLRSMDGGLNFISRSTTPNIMDYACDGSGTASQASYDLCITVDPNDANTLYVGGINNWKSTDGGTTWNIISHWLGSTYGSMCAASLHADQHVFGWSPLNGKLYIGHDGGLHWTNDGGSTWTNISGGLEINQIYRIGQSATNADLVIMGQQDNGTSVSTGSGFTTVIGGDGLECLVDYSNANYRYGTYTYGSIRRSTGGSYDYIATATNGITETGAWLTPYTLHATDPNTMFAGFKNVWRTGNVKTALNTAVVWAAISAGETTTCKALEQSPADVNIVYVVRSGSIKRSDNANAAPASVTWTACTLPGGYTPTYLETHPTDANIVYATANYGVYKSNDKGVTWSDISGTLPSLFTNCIVYDKNSNEGLYVGNQTSVFYRNASMSDWVLFSSGLPPADVRELEIFYDPVGTQNRLKAATYGRGLWQTDLYESGVLNPPDFTATAVSNTRIDLEWNLNPSGDNVVLAYNTVATFGTPENGTPYAETSTIPDGGTVLFNGSSTAFSHSSLAANSTYYYKLWSYDGTTTYSTGTTANATTFCTLVSSFPWSEGFEHAGSMPACWTQEYDNGATPWEMKTAGTNSHPAAAHAGTYLARLRTLTSGGNYRTKFVSPPIDLSPVSNPLLKFWHTQEFWSPNQDELRVYYRTSVTGAWTLLATYTTSISSWTEETISLPDASSAYFIAFQGTVNAGYGICVDDVTVMSGCTNPGIPSLSSSADPICNGTSTTLSVTSGNLNNATVWQWYTGSCGGAPAGNGTSVEVSPANSTNYYVRGEGGCVTPGNCAEITVTVNQPSYAPTPAKVSDLEVTGENIKWYPEQTGGSPLSPSTELISGNHYWASQTINGCESAARFEVTATVDLTPCAPAGNAAQTFGAGATVIELQATGQNIRWYDTATGGSVLPGTTPLVNGNHYWATQSIDCTESASRLEVTVTM